MGQEPRQGNLGGRGSVDGSDLGEGRAHALQLGRIDAAPVPAQQPAAPQWGLGQRRHAQRHALIQRAIAAINALVEGLQAN